VLGPPFAQLTHFITFVDASTFQTVTNDFVTNFWNTVQNSPVFVARTLTNVIPGQVIRLPQDGEGGGGNSGNGGGGGPSSSSSSISNNSSGTLFTPPNSPLDLDLSDQGGTGGPSASELGPLQLGYNQTISFNILPPFVINPVSNELFLLPFLSNPRAYTLLLASATNNTGLIRIASIRIAPLPTNPPTPTPSFVAQDDRNIIIITVVITVTSLAMAGGYILYQGRIEQQEGLVSLEESISYTEEDLYRQSIAMARNPSQPSRWWTGSATSTARESASADAEAASATSPPAAPPVLSQTPSSVAVGAMGAATAVSAATSVFSDLASAAVSAVQGLVSAPAPPPAQQPVATLRVDGQLEEILEADESRTLSPSVHTAGGSDAQNNAGTSSTSAFLGGGGSAMGTMGTETGLLVSSSGSGGAGVPMSTSGGTAEQEGLRADESQPYQPRYPTYSSLPISVISDEIDLPFHHSPYPTVYPPPNSNVDPSWLPDPMYAGGGGMQHAQDGAYGMGAQQQLPLASGIPIVTDLSLSTVLNSDELDLPVSPLAMMGFQLDIQDLDDFGEGDAASSGPSHRGTDRFGDDRGGKARR
jgi:hypothetical protein